jgi:hypothetical protein
MDYLQWIGYIASIIIAISMVMNSLLKLRLINFFGALSFATYGYLIGAYPVGILNSFIVCVDIYYLSKIFLKKEYFKVLYVRANNYYLLNFLEFYLKDIQKFNPGFTYKSELNTLSFFILRDMHVAGIILAHEIDKDKLMIGLDYSIPNFRDFKLGKYVYKNINLFKERGINELYAKARSKKHEKYLRKMGFDEGEFDGLKLMVMKIK